MAEVKYCNQGHPGYDGPYCGPCMDEDVATGTDHVAEELLLELELRRTER